MLVTSSWTVITTAGENNYMSQQQKYCSDINLQSWQLTPEQRESKRSDFKTGLKVDFKKVKKAIDDGKPLEVVKEIAFPFAVTVILFIVTLLAIPFFIVTCCCAKKSSVSASQKFFFYLSIIVLILFAAFFWTMVGYIANID